MFLVCSLAALCGRALGAREPDLYFADDFDTYTLGATPTRGAHGYGWRKVVPFAEPSAFEVVKRPGGPAQARCARLRSGGRHAPVVDAQLRLPERARVVAAFKARFDSSQEGELAVAFCHGDYTRVCRLIFRHPAGSAQVQVFLEDGAKDVRQREVAVLPAGKWASVTWHNDALANTASLHLGERCVFDRRPVTRLDRFTRRAFSRLRLHPGRRGQVWIDSLTITPPPSRSAPAVKHTYDTEPKEAVLCVDFFDLCFWASQRERRLYTPDDIERLMVEAKRAGFSFVLWRVSACGSAVYRSRIEDRGFRQDRRPDAHAAADFIDRWDPLAQACRIGHRVGLPVFVWMTVYDEGLKRYGHYSALLREHPEYQWVDRSGKNHFEGVPCYAFPQARRFRVEMVQEVCRYPVDGIFLSFRSHSVQSESYRQAKEFGYEPPVVDEYRRRHGLDIRTQDFDREKWHRLKGEFFTQLLREIRTAVGPWRPVHVVILHGVDGPSGKSQHALDMPTWVRDKLVDAIHVQAHATTPPADFASHYEPLRKLGARLYCFRGIPDEDATFENVPNLMAAVKGTPFHGMSLMEAYKFQLLRGQKRR